MSEYRRRIDQLKMIRCYTHTFPGIAALMNNASVSGHGSNLYCSHQRFTIKLT